MNKHVESLPKVDKSITFHYCTVICDVLWPIDVIFFVSIFFKVGKFATFSERPKAKSVSSHLYLGGTSNFLTPALRLHSVGTGSTLSFCCV